ncbi:hypothetical protein JXB27_00010 [Candidatus Woesearchaeota archaeon]|nr:hypothetical protein [Candidatus Woesearchaeota archaeon]
MAEQPPHEMPWLSDPRGSLTPGWCTSRLNSAEEKIDDYVDKRIHVENNGLYVEIIFGLNRVFVMINTETDKQYIISNFLNSR